MCKIGLIFQMKKFLHPEIFPLQHSIQNTLISFQGLLCFLFDMPHALAKDSMDNMVNSDEYLDFKRIQRILLKRAMSLVF